MTTRREFIKTAAIAGGSLSMLFASGVLKVSARRIIPPTGLSEEERAAILDMREEEKLARDVYTYLYKQWGLTIFSNISSSEQMHMNAVATLLTNYNLSDPASRYYGVFTNAHLQGLYDQLILQGVQSEVDAVLDGLTIEEIDIIDLRNYLAINDQADISQVFNNILNGSYHHLRAFASTYTNLTGLIYQPQYLSQEDYQAIIDSGSTGGGSGGGGGGRGGYGPGSG